MKTNLGGKLSFSADLSPDKAVCVEIEKIISNQKLVIKRAVVLPENGRAAAYVVYEDEQE